MPHRRTTQERTPLTQRAARGAPRLSVARTTPCVYALCPHSVDLAAPIRSISLPQFGRSRSGDG
eukprot:scaffold12130_cov101-Isochrysis_galbana.AAC.1